MIKITQKAIDLFIEESDRQRLQGKHLAFIKEVNQRLERKQPILADYLEKRLFELTCGGNEKAGYKVGVSQMFRAIEAQLSLETQVSPIISEKDIEKAKAHLKQDFNLRNFAEVYGGLDRLCKENDVFGNYVARLAMNLSSQDLLVSTGFMLGVINSYDIYSQAFKRTGIECN